MYTFEKNKEKLLNKIKNGTDKDLNAFFSTIFNKFNTSSQIRILDLFETTTRDEKRNIDLWNCFLIRNPQIITCITNKLNFSSILNNNDISLEDKITFSNTYFNILYYTKNNFSNNDKIDSIKDLVTFLEENKECLTNHKLESLLMTIFKNLSKNSIQTLTNENIYEKLENVALQFINESNPLELINSNILNVFIEVSPSIDVSKIIEALKTKCESIKSDQYLKDNHLFLLRLKNGILPKNLCYDIICDSSYPNKYKRVALIDYMRHLLEEKGIKKCSVIYDNQINRQGCASIDRIRLYQDRPNDTCFHELMHLIQNNEMIVTKKYIGNRYLMLKDWLLAGMIDYQSYLNNYDNQISSWLFEKEAIEYGINEIYKFRNEKEMKTREVEYLDTVTINGNILKKDVLFDKLLKENLDILDDFPILQIEYNSDGSKKSDQEILDNINKRFLLTNDSEERNGIYNSIYGKHYSKEKTSAKKF